MLFLFESTFSQNSKKIAVFKSEPYELKYASESINEIINYNTHDSLVKFYITDYKTTDSLIKLSNKQYKIVFIYTYWCKPCIETLPQVQAYVNEHQNNFDLFIITGDRYEKIPFNIYYLENKLHYYSPAFMLDLEKYGKSKRGLSRINKFIKQMCKICEYKKMGYSSYIVFNNENKIILNTTWEFDIDRKLRELKILPLLEYQRQ